MLADIASVFDGIIQDILSVLPVSPFTQIIQTVRSWEWLGWINWFVPFGQAATLGVAWLAAIALYYGYSVIARWVKLIA